MRPGHGLPTRYGTVVGVLQFVTVVTPCGFKKDLGL